jgi:hypothetical protein
MDELFSHKKFQMLQFTAGEKMTIDRLHYSIQQLFVARYINSGFRKRLFLNHDMGSGKTISSLLSANDNRELYKILGEGNVIVLGFQRETFLNEIFSKPDLGYITKIEFEKLNSFDPFDANELEAREKYRQYLKKKVLTKEHIKFIGYQELYNMLFYEGQLVQDVLDLFSNSFIIGDEIHNVYNSQETNLYGTAIKEILKYYNGRGDEPKVLLMSGTPINNKPSEIIDILNLLVPDLDLKKQDYFKMDDVELLLPGALAKIKNYADGYFSVYVNEDPNFLPRRFFDGQTIGMLRFNVNPLTEPQKNLLEAINYKISMEDHNVLDGAFPLPDGEWFYKNKDFARLQYTSIDWRQKMGISITEGKISGNILLEKNIGLYIPKYKDILVELKNLIRVPQRRGKVIIYHDYINGFGIKLLEQVLIMNGYLDIHGMVTPDTVCVKCAELNRDHQKANHDFEPARFVSMYGEIPKNIINENMTYFNSEANKNGDKFLILLGSEMIREGYNFKCVREIWISHLMPHASAMQQLWGRAIRLYSHQSLPPENREVHLKIFANDVEIEYYTKKMENYKIIQEIMRVINMNAVDISFYYEFVKQSFRETGEMGLLTYPKKPRVKKIIKLDTYDVFFASWEVEEITKIIEYLFVERPAWTYADLWKAVRHPQIVQYVDNSQFKEDNFVLALGNMIYGLNPTIIKRGDISYKILPVFNLVTYYVTYPVVPAAEATYGKKMENIYGHASPYFISWLQPAANIKSISFQINESIVDLNSKYTELKAKFFEKFGKSDMVEIPKSTELYGLEFHMRLLEESISYVFNILTHKNKNKSEYHEFYFKLIFFYNKLDVVLYANMLDEKHAKLYENYTVAEVNTNTLLKSILSNVSSSVSSFDMTGVERFLETDKKTAANILPVGHLLSTNIGGAVEPKLYTPQGWIIVQNLELPRAESRENDIIVGFYERSDEFLDFKFKLRSPIHKIEQKSDKREMEKGMVCTTIKKERLTEIGKSLNINLTTTSGDYCNEIKKYLLHMELKDRNMYREGKVPIRTRYCYLPFEN